MRRQPPGTAVYAPTVYKLRQPPGLPEGEPARLRTQPTDGLVGISQERPSAVKRLPRAPRGYYDLTRAPPEPPDQPLPARDTPRPNEEPSARQSRLPPTSSAVTGQTGAGV